MMEESWIAWTMDCALSHTTLSHQHLISWINLAGHYYRLTMDWGLSPLQLVYKSNSGSLRGTTLTVGGMSGGGAVCRRGSMKSKRSKSWILQMRRWQGLKSGGSSKARRSWMRSRGRPGADKGE